MRRTITLTLIAGLILAGCSAGDSGTFAEPSAASVDWDDGAEAAPEEMLDSEADSDRAASMQVDVELGTDRQVIRQASLELHATDTRQAYTDIVAMVESVGGFVASANVFPTSGEDRQPTVTMTLRVPSDQLDATMTAIKDSVDEVVSESQGAEDVSEQFVDLQARLTNLEALEVELRALLEEVRMQPDSDPDKILRVFNELSSTRGQIEQIQGRINHLSDLTSLATLQVELTQTPSEIPIVDEPWTPIEAARDAVRSLVTGLQGVADWGISFALFTLPMLIVTVGPLALIGFFVYRKWIRRDPDTKTPDGPAPAES